MHTKKHRTILLVIIILTGITCLMGIFTNTSKLIQALELINLLLWSVCLYFAGDADHQD